MNHNKKHLSHLFQVHISGPLTEEIKTQLENKNIKLLEYFHPHSYVVRLTTEEAEKLKTLSFVIKVEKYKVHLLMISTPTEHKSDYFYDVGVYDSEDMKDVKLWFDDHQKDVGIVCESQQKIRIKVSSLDYVYNMLKDVPSTVKYFEEYITPSFSNKE